MKLLTASPFLAVAGTKWFAPAGKYGSLSLIAFAVIDPNSKTNLITTKRPFTSSPTNSTPFSDRISKMDGQMEIDIPLGEVIKNASESKSKSSKSHDIYATTIKTSLYAYAHLKLITKTNSDMVLDDLTIRQYLTAALKQFLGITGAGMPIDILMVSGQESWVRVPQQDLGAFAAAVTAWIGTGSSVSGFRICAAGDFLGALVGRYDQKKIWGES